MQCIETQFRPALEMDKKIHLLMRRDSNINKFLFDKIYKSVSKGQVSKNNLLLAKL